MRVAIAQVNPTVGDLRGNRKLVEEAAARAAGRADLVVLPELVLTGYPPMDLLERDGFVRDQLAELDALRGASRRVPIALGAVMPAEPRGPRRLYNAAVLLAGGEIAAVRPKSLLPSYDVFDERRYFRGGAQREVVRLASVVEIRGATSAVNTGLDKLRLSAPVPAGSRVRLWAEIRDVRSLPQGGARITFALRLEVEGSKKPALLAAVNYAYFP